jgi:hypothetical protein
LSLRLQARPRPPPRQWLPLQPRPLLLKRNLLASNEDYRHRRYQLNPGVRSREPFACVVERNRLYAIRARFWTDQGSVADLVYVDTFRVGGGG